MSTHDSFVVVGCDGTPGSDPALRFAAEEARLRGARLLLVAAYDRPIDPDLDDFEVADEVLQRRARDAASTNLQRALSSSPDQLPDHHVVAAEGDPAKVLLEQADGAVMIVIGSHDRSALQRLFGRVTSRELLHDTVVPVTIVPSIPPA